MPRAKKQVKNTVKKRYRKAIGFALRTMRHYRGRTAADVAYDSGRNSRDNYFRIERGVSAPTTHNLGVLLETLGFTWAEFGRLVDLHLANPDIEENIKKEIKNGERSIVSDMPNTRRRR